MYVYIYIYICIYIYIPLKSEPHRQPHMDSAKFPKNVDDGSPKDARKDTMDALFKKKQVATPYDNSWTQNRGRDPLV